VGTWWHIIAIHLESDAHRRWLLKHLANLACSLARPKAGNNMLASIAMMAMTTSSSISVKPPGLSLSSALSKWWALKLGG